MCPGGRGPTPCPGGRGGSSGPPPRPFAFTSSAGHALAGTLVPPPTGSASPASYAILLHGLNSHRDDSILPALASRLQAEAGVGSLRYDAAGNGASGGPFRFANYEEEAADVARAVAALQAAEAGAQVVAVAGHSKAGTVAVLAAAALSLPLCINLAGRFHLDTGLEARFGEGLEGRLAGAGGAGLPVTWRRGGQPFTWRLTASDVAARRGPTAVDVGRACASLPASTSVLHVHGSEDGVVPVREVEAYAASSGHCAASEVVIIPGGDHNFTTPGCAAAAVEAVVRFVAGRMPDKTGV